jgi:hypothetical protein
MIITSNGTEIFGRWVDGKYQQLEYNLAIDNQTETETETQDPIIEK